jgi:Chromatin associated protein KTI12
MQGIFYIQNGGIGVKTNLIIVEGIPGSGKSTTANFIKEHLEKKGVKAKLYQEGDTSHPADYESTACLSDSQFYNILERFPEYRDAIQECTEKKGKKYFTQYRDLENIDSSIVDDLAPYDVYELELDTYEEVSYNYWREFIEKTKFGDEVYIFECCFLQNPFTKFIAKHNASPLRLGNHLMKISALMKPLNPLLIYLYQENIDQSFNPVYQERSQDWRDFFTDYHVNQGYGKENGLKGYKGLVEFLERRRDQELRIIEDLPVQTLLIQNDERDWEEYYDNVKEAIK